MVYPVSADGIDAVFGTVLAGGADIKKCAPGKKGNIPGARVYQCYPHYSREGKEIQ